MPHIHTKPGQHDHTASAYIFRTDFDEPKLLLHKHKKLGVYLQFGGHIELDETPWQAVSHEILEESGYDMDQLQILQPKDRMKELPTATLHPYPICHNTHNFDENHLHTDLAYAFVTNEPPAHKVGEGESGKIRLVTRSELEAMSTGEIYDGVRQIGLYAFDNCLPDWEQVGPTSFA